MSIGDTLNTFKIHNLFNYILYFLTQITVFIFNSIIMLDWMDIGTFSSQKSYREFIQRNKLALKIDKSNKSTCQFCEICTKTNRYLSCKCGCGDRYMQITFGHDEKVYLKKLKQEKKNYSKQKFIPNFFCFLTIFLISKIFLLILVYILKIF